MAYRLLDWQYASCRLHGHHRNAQPGLAQTGRQIIEVAFEPRPHIGIYRCGGDTIVFPLLRENVVAERHVYIPPAFFDQFAHSQFVVRIAMRVEKAHHEGLHVPCPQLAHRRANRLFIQRLFHGTVPAYSLCHADARRPRNQWLPKRLSQIVAICLGTFTQFEHIPESRSGNEPQAGAFTFDQQVGGDRRTVDEQGGTFQQCFERHAEFAGEPGQAIDYAQRLVARRR